MLMENVYRVAFGYFRKKRHQRAERELPLSNIQSVIDLGGYPSYWDNWKLAENITCINIDDTFEFSERDGINYLVGDACNTNLSDGIYDLCFSNSVIEHVGGWQKQRQFANEVQRLGRNYWVQTPNRYFFVEPHLIGAFLHWLPACRVQRIWCRYLTLWGLTNKPTDEEIAKYIADIQLLTPRQMQMLFPDAKIIRERFLFMTKSIVACRNIDQ
jgi:hypothetical protein